jgi:protein-S-isoprenylcysteine O-methyltransferase Ste14
MDAPPDRSMPPPLTDISARMAEPDGPGAKVILVRVIIGIMGLAIREVIRGFIDPPWWVAGLAGAVVAIGLWSVMWAVGRRSAKDLQDT